VAPKPTAAFTPQFALWFGLPIAAVTLAGLAFSPAIKGSFVFDDFHLPFADPKAASMPAAFWIGGVRPILMLSYWLNYALSGTETFSYHATNIALHSVTAVLVYFVIRRLLEISKADVDVHRASLFGSGVFLLHPLQTESVDYIAGRSEIACAAFLFAAWLVFLTRFEVSTTAATAAKILLLSCAAVLSKESGVCLIAILIATDFYWKPQSFAVQIRKRAWLYVPSLIGSLAAALLILRQLEHSTTAGLHSGATSLQYALTQCRAIAIYLKLFFIPVGQNVDWQLPIYRSFVEAWLYVLFMALLAAMVVWLFRKNRLASFGLLVFLLALAPTSSFVPIVDALAERRMYVPVVGLIVAMIGVAAKVRLHRNAKAGIALTCLLILGALSWNRSEKWSSDLALWQDSIEKNYANSRAHAGLGGAFMLRRDCAGAAREYRIVVDLQGMDEIGGRNLATSYECSGQTALALETYRRLVAIHPLADAYDRIGYLEGLQEHTDAALSAFETALRLDPNNVSAYAFRGVTKIALNDIPGARADFRRALALDPDNALAKSWTAKLSQTP
jgi:tetratricopeptide (TPR) repeat protein